jgi:hypothetical protein
MQAAQSDFLSRNANAPPVGLSHLFGGRSLPQFQLIQAIVFHFLVADAVPTPGCTRRTSIQTILGSRSLPKFGTNDEVPQYQPPSPRTICATHRLKCFHISPQTTHLLHLDINTALLLHPLE